MKSFRSLAKFLKSCVEEIKLVCYALGKTDLAQLDRTDLVSIERDLAQVLGIDYAGLPASGQLPQIDNQQALWIPAQGHKKDPDESYTYH